MFHTFVILFVAVFLKLLHSCKTPKNEFSAKDATMTLLQHVFIVIFKLGIQNQFQ